MGYYHVVNRVHGKAYLLDAEAAEEFCRIMRRMARFCGVEVITYCIMTNHVHLLVKVPPREKLPDSELFARYRDVAARSTYEKVYRQFERYRETGNQIGLADIRSRLAMRMYDLSAFMKELKQRFTQWYNVRNDCLGRGSFWTDRFKSTLVEGRGYALATVAAYIDLNPVRAKMVNDPKDYRWCGYAAALGGNPMAMMGLQTLLAEFGRRDRVGDRLDEVLAMYRMLLFGTAQRRSGSVTREQIDAVFAAEGMLPSWKIARHRASWVTDGLIIGSKAFVGNLATAWNDRLGLKRKRGSQQSPGEEGWCALRRSPT